MFRSTIDRCSDFLGSRLNQRLLSALAPGPGEPEIRDAALFAVEYALAELWQSWGIEPDAVLGAGVGEFVAAVVSGVLSCEDALKLVVECARVLRFADHDRKRDGKLGRPNEEHYRPVGIDESGELRATAGAMQFQAPKVPFVSGLTGQLLGEGQIPGAEYWCRHAVQRAQNLRRAQFDEGVSTLVAQGYDVFLEVGPPDSLPGTGCLPRSAIKEPITELGPRGSVH